MIRRKKTTIFTDAKETTTVKELKQMIEGILKVPPRDQCLYNKDNEVMSDDKQLQDYGIVMSSAKAQSPPQLGLALRYLSKLHNYKHGPYGRTGITHLSNLIFSIFSYRPQVRQWCIRRTRNYTIFITTRFAGCHENSRFSQRSSTNRLDAIHWFPLILKKKKQHMNE